MPTKEINGATYRVGNIDYRWTDEYNGRRRKAELLQDCEYEVMYKGGHEIIVVPKYYRTDFASIPLIAQVFLGDHTQFAEESVLHDWLCDNHIPRFMANAKMRNCMEAMGRPRWKVLAVFYALMIAGYGSPIFRVFTKLFSRKGAKL